MGRDHRSPIKGSPNRCLGVFNLHGDTSRSFFERQFAKFGQVEKADLVCDPCGYSRGFGFVTFERQKDADEAIRKMDDTMLDGRRIRVDYSISRGPHPPTPGGYVGNKSSAYIREGRGGVRRGFGERSKGHGEYDDRDRRGNYGQEGRRSDYRRRERSRSPTE